MFNIGSQELLIILLLVFIFFGPRYLPDAARTLGRGLGEVQRALHGVESSVRRATEETVDVGRKLPSIFDADVVPDPPRKALAAATTDAAGAVLPAVIAKSVDQEDPGIEPVNPS